MVNIQDQIGQAGDAAKKNWLGLVVTGALTAVLSGGVSFGTYNYTDRQGDTRIVERQDAIIRDVDQLRRALERESYERQLLAIQLQMITTGRVDFNRGITVPSGSAPAMDELLLLDGLVPDEGGDG